jgi:hypothetical protein
VETHVIKALGAANSTCSSMEKMISRPKPKLANPHFALPASAEGSCQSGAETA